MIDQESYRESIVGISHQIHTRQIILHNMRSYLEGNYKNNARYSVGLDFYRRGIKAMREIERLRAIKADMRFILELKGYIKRSA